MTHGYILINPHDVLQAEWYVLPSGQYLENRTPRPTWLHVLCVIRDAGDPPHDRLIEYFRAYNREGLAALPNTLGQVWNDYFERGREIDRLGIHFKVKKRKVRPGQESGVDFNKYADDPNWNEAVLCQTCNRYVRRGLYDKKHKVNCTAVRASDQLRDKLATSLGCRIPT
jgi:hypothetical protein